MMLNPEDAVRMIARYNGCSIAEVEAFAQNEIQDGGTIESVYDRAWQKTQQLGVCSALVKFLAVKRDQ